MHAVFDGESDAALLLREVIGEIRVWATSSGSLLTTPHSYSSLSSSRDLCRLVHASGVDKLILD
jgi:hypothetical protein